MSEQLSNELLELLGEEAFVALVDAFAGTRLYVPTKIPADHEIVKAIGQACANRLANRYAPAQIRVPLARGFRARHYRDRLNLSNAKIAVRLGMTEPGVNQLFARLETGRDRYLAQLNLDF